MSESPSVIDVHAHAMPASVVESFEREPALYDSRFEYADGERWLWVKTRKYGPLNDQWFDPARRLRDMDETGIEIQVLSPSPFLFCYWAEPDRAVEISIRVNDGMSEMASSSPRFWAIGQLPLQAIEASLAELDRFAELGLVGVEIGANVHGMELDDPRLEPVWAKLDELSLGVFVHPHHPVYVERLEPYYLTNTIGNPLDTTIAGARLLYGGIIERHPRIRFYFAHAGGFLPYLYGRIDHAYRVRPESAENVSTTPSELLSRCYFDTITHAEPTLRYLIDKMGSQTVVVGTDYPADMGDMSIASKLDEMKLPQDVQREIATDNAHRLFGVEA